MIIETNIKSKIQCELIDAKSFWIATAMISNNGWSFIQKNISKNTEQHFLIGIDLATEPKVFDELLDNLNINARVYQTNFTFHPKVYIFQKVDNSYVAYIGSSNTTNWGLEKNIEMNFQVNDQVECIKLLKWFRDLYNNGYIITKDFVEDYKSKFIKASFQKKIVQQDIVKISNELSKDEGQFFFRNHHQIFEKKYHRINSIDLKRIRREVRDKFKELHTLIYPQFKKYSLFDIHCHYNSREIVIHEDSLGIWLVLGRNNGSYKDRLNFREKMKDENIRIKFFDLYKKLGDEYWMNIENMPSVKNIKTPEQLHLFTQKESIDDYFIIGCDINWLDKRLSNENISNTILLEFQKLYPIYEIMKDR